MANLWHGLNRNRWHGQTEMPGTNQTVISNMEALTKRIGQNHLTNMVFAIHNINRKDIHNDIMVF